MALYHVATVTPSKADILAAWVPAQAWAPTGEATVELIGAFRFDDPDGRVGMETHLVSVDGVVLHVPLTYRDEPLDGAEDGFIVETEHSVLGTRWVYDGLRDPLCVTMLAAVAMTGQGEALGMVESDGRWHIAPSHVRISGGGWTQERVRVDGFQLEDAASERAIFRNEQFEMTVSRRPTSGPSPAIGLTATWSGQPAPVVLAEVRNLLT